MTATATLIKFGPIDGGFGTTAALYELSEPVTYCGEDYVKLIVSAIDADATGPASTIALPYGREGFAYDFETGLFAKWDEKLSHKEALGVLGYELVPAPVGA